MQVFEPLMWLTSPLIPPRSESSNENLDSNLPIQDNVFNFFWKYCFGCNFAIFMFFSKTLYKIIAEKVIYWEPLPEGDSAVPHIWSHTYLLLVWPRSIFRRGRYPSKVSLWIGFYVRLSLHVQLLYSLPMRLAWKITIVEVRYIKTIHNKKWSNHILSKEWNGAEICVEQYL